MNEQELKEAVLRLRGNCPTTDSLVGFQEGALPQIEAQAVAEHLSLCPGCSREVELLKGLDSDQRGEQTMPAEWESLERHARRRFEAALERLTQAPVGTFSRRTLAGQPSILLYAALAVIVLLVFPAYVGLRQWLSSPEPRGSLVTEVVHLSPPVRGLESPAQLVPAGQRAFVGVMFFIPEKDQGAAQYQCQIRDVQGREVYSTDNARSFDGLGNFLLVLSRQLLRPGENYTLSVTELNLEGRRTGQWEYSFTAGEDVQTPK